MIAQSSHYAWNYPLVLSPTLISRTLVCLCKSIARTDQCHPKMFTSSGGEKSGSTSESVTPLPPPHKKRTLIIPVQFYNFLHQNVKISYFIQSLVKCYYLLYNYHPLCRPPKWQFFHSYSIDSIQDLRETCKCCL